MEWKKREKETTFREREKENEVESVEVETKLISSHSFNFLLFFSPPLLSPSVFSIPHTMAAGAPAIKAAVQFAKAGTTAQKASVVKEIVIGMGLGLVCGVAFKVCSFLFAVSRNGGLLL